MIGSFPHFTKLALEDKDEYNAVVEKYPPFSDISFTNLYIWWNLEGRLSVCLLNKNLVINYSLPFAPEESGLSLIGTHDVDESIQTIFSYLKDQQKSAKLVHVPEFVVEKIHDNSLLDIAEETSWHEYIMGSHDLASLQHSNHSRTRRKVARFQREVEDREVNLMSLDLSSEDAKHLIFDSIMEWGEKYPTPNDPKRVEKDALEQTLAHSLTLDTQNLCLFVDGKLHGVVLYHLTVDKKHYIINHLRVDYQIPYIFDFMTHQIAKKAVENNVPYLNMEMDLGLEGLRQHKMRLRPVGFYKKYTIASKA